MANNIKIIGKFYMKSGAIIEEEIIFDTLNNKENAAKVIADIRCRIKEGFREDYNFQLTFGNTMFRGKDISAVSFVTVEL